MRRASWLDLACRKIVGSTIALTLAIGVLVTFSAAHASTTPNGRENTAAVAKGQIDTKFLVMDHDTVSSPLREGDTTFIIFLARSSALDRQPIGLGHLGVGQEFEHRAETKTAIPPRQRRHWR